MNDTDFRDPKKIDVQENKLKLEHIRRQQAELKQELERIEQEANSPLHSNEDESKETVSSTKPPVSLFICLTFLPPIGIIMLWMRKEHILMKIIFTLYALFMLALLTGLISFNLWPGFIFFAF